MRILTVHFFISSFRGAGHEANFCYARQNLKFDWTILVRLEMWMSSTEDYAQTQLNFKETSRFVAFFHHKYSGDRAYLITGSETFFYRKNLECCHSANPSEHIRNPGSISTLIQICSTGSKDCGGGENRGITVAMIGAFVESYVRNCAFG
jgi:hypothetical protein